MDAPSIQSSSSFSARPEHSLQSATTSMSNPASSSNHSTPQSVFNGVTSLFAKNPLSFASSLTTSTSSVPTPSATTTSQINADLHKQPGLSSLTGVQSAEVKRQRERERRIMPARLQRVSNLLAGSTIEDELSGANPKQEAHLLPPETKLVLYTSEEVGFATYKTDIKPQEGSLFATPAFVNACRARELIETPDFKTRDDTEMMGKTRAIRSEEDTSDAAYERRHRKPDNLEKKQRRLEKERLVRDRQKLKERIDQLRVADAKLLMPILMAREQHQKLAEGEVVPVAVAASPLGESEAGVKHNLGVDVAQTMAKLELLRTELLEEAHETLKRYDVLLAPMEMMPATSGLGKRKAGDNGGEDASGSMPKPIRSISVSGAFATKKGGQGANRSVSASTGKEKKSKSTKSQSPSSSRKRLSLGSTEPKDPQPFKPEDGPVRAENTYANIHARTSGGRFAPKAALSGTTGSTSKINTKGKWKKEGEPKVKRSRSSNSSKSAGSGKVSANSLIESTSTSGSKPKRVKIILSKRQKANLGASDSSNGAIVTDAKEEEEEEEDFAPEPQIARAALTLEEAQALLAKAMEDDDDDDEDVIEMQVKNEDSSMS